MPILQPENILVRDDYSLVLTDFGSAKETGGTAATAGTAGGVVGTWAYMCASLLYCP